MKLTLKTISVLGICTFLANATYANDINKESYNDRKFYIGGNIGYSGPLKASFEDKETKSIFSIKKSPMYSGYVGYKVTPDIMIEFSGEYKPTYKLGIKLAEADGGERVNTKAQSQVYMINTIYNFKEVNGFQPYFLAGAGLARIRVKEVAVPLDLNAMAAAAASAMYGAPISVADVIFLTNGGFNAGDKFRTLKHTSNCFAWQIGLGVSKAITESFRINLGGKLQIIHNVGIKYRAPDVEATKAKMANGIANAATYKTDKIKKTLGVGEATLGFTFDLPF